MRIGMAQMDISWENIEDNKKKVEQFFKKAEENQVDCLVFPEMTLTGFSMNVEETGEKSENQKHFFEEMSKKYKIFTVFGYTEPVPEERLKEHPNWNHYYNRLGIAENGELKLNYAKIHPFSYGFEGEYYQGGRKLKSVEWKGTTLGAFVCYDLRFPEIFQISSEKSVNRTGEGDGLHYNGHSAIYSPNGEAVTTIREEECLLIGDINPEEIKEMRKTFPMKNDRREELYIKMWENAPHQ